MAEYLKHQAFTYIHQVRQKEIVTQCVASNPYNTSVEPYLVKKALWDTGATVTAVSMRIVKLLKLKPVRRSVDVVGVHGSARVHFYPAMIILPKDVRRVWQMVLGLDTGDNADVIIGMDIIGTGDFSVSDGKTISYRYPPLTSDPTDFSQNIKPDSQR